MAFIQYITPDTDKSSDRGDGKDSAAGSEIREGDRIWGSWQKYFLP